MKNSGTAAEVTYMQVEPNSLFSSENAAYSVDVLIMIVFVASVQAMKENIY